MPGRGIIAALAALSALAGGAMAQAPQVTDFPPGAVFEQVSNPGNLSAAVTRQLEDYRNGRGDEARYFGSFVVSGDGQFGVWVGRYHDPAKAEADALQICATFSRQDCSVIGHLVPRGFEAPVPQMLGEEAGPVWRRYLTGPAPKAFAVDQTNSYAVQVGAETLEQARTDALFNCAQGAFGPLDLPDTCVIIHEAP